VGAFEADITKFCRKTGLRVETVVRKVALDALRRVVLRSPVDTGRFRANWMVGIGEADTTYNEDDTDPTGAKALAEGERRLELADNPQMVVLSNNVPYAGALEEGHSQQAPIGILRPTFEELKNDIRQLIREGT